MFTLLENNKLLILTILSFLRQCFQNLSEILSVSGKGLFKKRWLPVPMRERGKLSNVPFISGLDKQD